MRDHHQRRLGFQQVISQPLHSLHVKVVGRFVQHQQIQFLHQRRRKVGAPPLPTRQLPYFAIQPEFGDSQAVQHVTHAAFRRPLERLHPQRFQHDVGHRVLWIQVGFLRDHRHPDVVHLGHASLIGLLPASEHLQQGGFTTAVQSDHADAVAGLHAQTHPIKQGFQTKGFRDVFYADKISHSTV